MKFLPGFGTVAGNRRKHDETIAPEPQPGFQGESGACRLRGAQGLVELSQHFDGHANLIKQWKVPPTKEGCSFGATENLLLCGVDQSRLVQVDFGMTVYLAVDEFQADDLPVYLPVQPA